MFNKELGPFYESRSSTASAYSQIQCICSLATIRSPGRLEHRIDCWKLPRISGKLNMHCVAHTLFVLIAASTMKAAQLAGFQFHVARPFFASFWKKDKTSIHERWSVHLHGFHATGQSLKCINCFFNPQYSSVPEMKDP